MTATLKPLAAQSRDLNGFYVPQFELRIEGVGLPRDVLRDVTQVTYRDDIKELDGCEVVVNNWDVATRTFKYVGSESSASRPANDRHRIFDPCGNRKFQLYMGYRKGGSAMGGNEQDLTLMMEGLFVSAEPTFPSSGASTLSVQGLNSLHQLRRKQNSDTWFSRKDSEIARILGAKPNRLPCKVVIDPASLDKEEDQPVVVQKNQYDIDFLWTRARQHGYVVLVREVDKRRRGGPAVRELYFGPSQQATQNEVLELKWGLSLVEFRPRLNLANQVSKVTVRGWSREAKDVISESFDLDRSGVDFNDDLKDLVKACATADAESGVARQEIVVKEPLYTRAQAQRRARAILSERFKEIITASGSCVGMPTLRAGARVQIEGIGERFSGIYFVTSSTHTIDDGGYMTKFTARREHRR